MLEVQQNTLLVFLLVWEEVVILHQLLHMGFIWQLRPPLNINGELLIWLGNQYLFKELDMLEYLVKYLKEENADVIINDINKYKVNKISKKYKVKIFSDQNFYDLDVDIYAPCALGSTLNPFTINRLKCCIVAGAANNQLEDELRDSELLMKKGVLYAPDFLINAGGLINVYSELNGYDKDAALKQTSEIYNTTLNIFKTSV